MNVRLIKDYCNIPKHIIIQNVIDIDNYYGGDFNTLLESRRVLIPKEYCSVIDLEPKKKFIVELTEDYQEFLKGKIFYEMEECINGLHYKGIESSEIHKPIEILLPKSICIGYDPDFFKYIKRKTFLKQK